MNYLYLFNKSCLKQYYSNVVHFNWDLNIDGKLDVKYFTCSIK